MTGRADAPAGVTRSAAEQCLIIATTPRSGSWLLAEGLRSLDVAGRPEEFFRPDVEDLYRRRWRLDATAPFPEFVRRAVAAGRSGNGVSALKAHWSQFAALLARLRAAERGAGTGDGAGVRGDGTGNGRRPGDGDLPLLRRHLGDVAFVHLERQDTLRQAVSWYRAIATDEWWWVDGDARGRCREVGFDFEGVKHLYHLLLDDKAAWRAWLAWTGAPTLPITYERLAADYDGCLRDVLRFLGLLEPADVPAPRLRRQSDAETQAWVRDYVRAREQLFPSGAGRPVEVRCTSDAAPGAVLGGHRPWT